VLLEPRVDVVGRAVLFLPEQLEYPDALGLALHGHRVQLSCVEELVNQFVSILRDDNLDAVCSTMLFG